MKTDHNLKPPPLVAAFILLLSLGVQGARALSEMDDAGMADINGHGIAFLPENLQIAFNDLAYIQAIPTSLPLSATNVADLYWYGVQLTGANSAGANTGNVTSRAGYTTATTNPWGSADNPWLLKVESPTAYLYNGALSPYPVFNYYAPRARAADQFVGGAAGDGKYQSIDNGGLKYSFWGDVIVRDRNTSGCASNPTTCAEVSRMQSQSIWNDFTMNGSRFSIFQNTYDQSFGLSWINRLNSASTGVMRFSVAETTQAVGTPATAAPVFSDSEGLFITDMDINMIVGVQHYQPLTLDNAANVDNVATPSDETRNLSIELVRIPNTPSVYGAFYRNYASSTAPELAKMCTNATLDCTAATHGQLRMGNVTFKDPGGATSWAYTRPPNLPSGPKDNLVYDNGGADTANGNIGSLMIDGLMIQHLKITTTGI